MYQKVLEQRLIAFYEVKDMNKNVQKGTKPAQILNGAGRV